MDVGSSLNSIIVMRWLTAANGCPNLLLAAHTSSKLSASFSREDDEICGNVAQWLLFVLLWRAMGATCPTFGGQGYIFVAQS